ncbi:MAG: YceI family protein [Cryomorphaceae bacterium]
MRVSSRLKLLFLLLLIFRFADSDAQGLFQSNQGRIHFVSEAPLELIEAETESFQIIVDTVKMAFAVTMQIESFKGFNSALQQEHFYENYMEIDLYPKAIFTGKILNSLSRNSKSSKVKVKGSLTIHGVEKQRVIEANFDWTEEGNLLVEAFFTVPLEDHEIEIPRIVYQKIAEEINVSVTALLKPRN